MSFKAQIQNKNKIHSGHDLAKIQQRQAYSFHSIILSHTHTKLIQTKHKQTQILKNTSTNKQKKANCNSLSNPTWMIHKLMTYKHPKIPQNSHKKRQNNQQFGITHLRCLNWYRRWSQRVLWCCWLTGSPRSFLCCLQKPFSQLKTDFARNLRLPRLKFNLYAQHNTTNYLYSYEKLVKTPDFPHIFARDSIVPTLFWQLWRTTSLIDMFPHRRRLGDVRSVR